MQSNGSWFKIISETENEFDALTNYLKDIKPEHIHRRIDNKWTIAENMVHLIASLQSSKLAMVMPKFLLRWAFGKPQRPSQNYYDFVNLYKQKLSEGAVASGRYVPKIVKKTKKQLIEKWIDVSNSYISVLNYEWKEKDYDSYQVPHPILGKITIRELFYFNIYHTWHHRKAIKYRDEEATYIPE